jgi:hypothetical protein
MIKPHAGQKFKTCRIIKLELFQAIELIELSIDYRDFYVLSETHGS